MRPIIRWRRPYLRRNNPGIPTITPIRTEKKHAWSTSGPRSRIVPMISMTPPREIYISVGIVEAAQLITSARIQISRVLAFFTTNWTWRSTRPSCGTDHGTVREPQLPSDETPVYSAIFCNMDTRNFSFLNGFIGARESS